MEKLVYRRHVNTSATGWSHWQDVKSIHQAKYVLGRGVHYARNVEVLHIEAVLASCFVCFFCLFLLFARATVLVFVVFCV